MTKPRASLLETLDLMPSTFKVTGNYRPDIDGLRAIAVGGVVAFHAFPNLFKGGFVGVDIFFVISGFLISGIIFEALESGTFSYWDFYARRARRILPALLLVCAVVSLVGWYVLLPDEFRLLGKSLAASAGFVANFALWNEAGYFDPSSDSKPLLHLWSLGIEEQFYILWPLALGFTWRRTRNFTIVIGTVAVLSFAVNLATVHSNPVAAFYSPLSRFWELMMGGMLAYLTIHKPQWLARFANLRSCVGLGLIVASIFMLNKEMAFPGWWALLPTLGSVLVISASSQSFANKMLLSNPVMVGFGLISYSLYLWHWPALVFFKFAQGAFLTPTDRAAAIVLSIVLAALTYRFTERPFRRSFNPQTALGLVAATASLALIGGVMFAGGWPSRLKDENIERILAATTDWQYPPVASENHSMGALRYFQQNSGIESYTLFFGDSNLEQYGPRIDRAIKDHTSTFRGAIMVGNQQRCLLLMEILSDRNQCPAEIATLKSLIARKSTRAVTIAVSWLGYEKALMQPEGQSRFTQFLRSIAPDKSVFIILNIPQGAELSPHNMFEGSRLGTIALKPVANIVFDFDQFEEHYRNVNSMLSAVAAASGATVIDPVSYLCPQRTCPIFDDTGTPLYRDTLHITRSYAIQATGYIDATLDDSRRR
jgi:peptidoglycan/LPS O-acetylase OafA/YrhL